jgi:hypothetical protein
MGAIAMSSVNEVGKKSVRIAFLSIQTWADPQSQVITTVELVTFLPLVYIS